MITKRRNKDCITFASFLFIPKGLRVLPLSMRYAFLAFRTLSLLDLVSSSGMSMHDVVSRVIIGKKVF